MRMSETAKEKESFLGDSESTIRQGCRSTIVVVFSVLFIMKYPALKQRFF